MARIGSVIVPREKSCIAAEDGWSHYSAAVDLACAHRLLASPPDTGSVPRMVREHLSTGESRAARIVIVSGEAGSGKKYLLSQCIQFIRREMGIENRPITWSFTTRAADAEFESSEWMLDYYLLSRGQEGAAQSLMGSVASLVELVDGEAPNQVILALSDVHELSRDEGTDRQALFDLPLVSLMSELSARDHVTILLSSSRALETSWADPRTSILAVDQSNVSQRQLRDSYEYWLTTLGSVGLVDPSPTTLPADVVPFEFLDHAAARLTAGMRYVFGAGAVRDLGRIQAPVSVQACLARVAELVRGNGLQGANEVLHYLPQVIRSLWEEQRPLQRRDLRIHQQTGLWRKSRRRAARPDESTLNRLLARLQLLGIIEEGEGLVVLPAWIAKWVPNWLPDSETGSRSSRQRRRRALAPGPVLDHDVHAALRRSTALWRVRSLQLGGKGRSARQLYSRSMQGAADTRMPDETAPLGASGSRMTALSWMLRSGMTRVPEGMDSSELNWLLDQAEIVLVEQGRLRTARRVIAARLQAALQDVPWSDRCALSIRHSRLDLELGELESALEWSRKAMSFAQKARSERDELVAGIQYADCCIAQGRTSEAKAAFELAAQMQSRLEPDHPLLYPPRGFVYYWNRQHELQGPLLRILSSLVISDASPSVPTTSQADRHADAQLERMVSELERIAGWIDPETRPLAQAQTSLLTCRARLLRFASSLDADQLDHDLVSSYLRDVAEELADAVAHLAAASSGDLTARSRWSTLVRIETFSWFIAVVLNQQDAALHHERRIKYLASVLDVARPILDPRAGPSMWFT